MNVTLLGRFMLEDRREFPCQTQNMSPGSLALTTPITGRVGERVVAYIDHIGRVEGQIARVLEDGFAMTIHATPRKKDKIAAKLTWLANRHELDLPEDRRHDRATPNVSTVTLSLPDGRQYPARVIDMSLSGAAVSAEVKPPVGSPLLVGKIRGTVVRHFDEGMAIEFVTLQTASSLEQNLA